MRFTIRGTPSGPACTTVKGGSKSHATCGWKNARLELRSGLTQPWRGGRLWVRQRWDKVL